MRGSTEDLVSRLRGRVALAKKTGFYEQSLCDVDPARLQSLADFTRLPLTDRETFYRDYQEHGPFGSFYTDDVVRFCFTPSPHGLVPVYHTQSDLDAIHTAMHRILAGAGIGPATRAGIFFSYHTVVAGLLFHGVCESMGVKALPLGPGNTADAVDLIERLDVQLLICNPTFAFQLAAVGATAPQVLLVTGEPFSAVPGRREQLKAAFPKVRAVLDMYGLAEIGPVAMNCVDATGVHIFDDLYHAEIIDPVTESPLDDGATGELVLTPLQKEATPVIRFRTGDLAYLRRAACTCGRSITMPDGVVGRADDMLKVKGVKFYPSLIGPLIRRYPDLDGPWQAVIESRQGRDHVAVHLEGNLGADELTDFAAVFRRRLLFSPDEILDGMTVGDAPDVIDARNGHN